MTTENPMFGHSKTAKDDLNYLRPKMYVQANKQPPSRATKNFKRIVLGVVGLIVLSLTINEIHQLSLTPEQRAAEIAQAKKDAKRAAVRAENQKLDAKYDAEYKAQKAEQVAASAKANASKSQLSALDKMVIAFKGGYTKDQIERETTAVLRLFDQPLSDTNYEQLGGAVVALRDGIKPNTEMDILICMKDLKRSAGDVKMDIPYTAALCATSISAGQ